MSHSPLAEVSDGARSGASTPAGTDSKHHDTDADAAKKKQETSARAKSDAERVKVYDNRLYTDLLDASDWSEHLRRERAQKRIEALAQHSEEEEIERRHREELKRRVAADTKQIADARARQESETKLKQEMADFRRRNDTFLEHHRQLQDAWAPLQEAQDAHRHRLRQRLYETWDREVFLPTQREINAKVAAKCGDGPPTEASRRAAASWGRRQDAFWKTFLHESNRKAKTAPRGGLFLDVLDEVEYNPLQKCRDETITYKRRTLPASEVDRLRDEAQLMGNHYTALALRYREEERRSHTGVLQNPVKEGSEAVDNAQVLVGGALHPHGNTSRSLSVVSLPTVTSRQSMTGGGGGGSGSPRMPAPSAYEATSTLPRTHVPFNFQDSAAGPPPPQQSSSMMKTLSQVPHQYQTPRSAADIFHAGAPLHMGSCRAGTAPPGQLAVSDVTQHNATIRAKAGRTETRTVLECDRDVLPLPLDAVPNIPTYRQAAATAHGSILHRLPWVDGTAAEAEELARRAVPREAYLPVRSWAKQPFLSTIYGHNTTEDGDAAPISEVKQSDSAWRAHSNVMMDHFNFPRTAEEPHFGKRMCVWRQL